MPARGLFGTTSCEWPLSAVRGTGARVAAERASVPRAVAADSSMGPACVGLMRRAVANPTPEQTVESTPAATHAQPADWRRPPDRAMNSRETRASKLPASHAATPYEWSLLVEIRPA